jgi:cobalt-zinc-cadmium efflux system protein
MGTGHSHSGSAAVAHKGRLKLVLAITLTILAAEVAGALLSGSLTLLADAGHMLMDAGGIALALLAISFEQRSPSQARTFGYLRLEILAAALNALLLFAVSVFVIVEAVRRLIHPPAVASGIMLAFGIVALCGTPARCCCCATARARASTSGTHSWRCCRISWARPR